MKGRKFLLTVAAIAVLSAAGWVAYISSKQMDRNQRIKGEVADLLAEEDKIRIENDTLREKIEYFRSQDFLEQEAKQKLGRKKSDETVVVIKPGAVYDDTSRAVPAVAGSAKSNGDAGLMAQPERWWKAFFDSR